MFTLEFKLKHYLQLDNLSLSAPDFRICYCALSTSFVKVIIGTALHTGLAYGPIYLELQYFKSDIEQLLIEWFDSSSLGTGLVGLCVIYLIEGLDSIEVPLVLDLL